MAVCEKPIGCVSVVLCAAADVADATLIKSRYVCQPVVFSTKRGRDATHAELAALASLLVLSRTRSITWTTPLLRRTSGWMMCAVVFPEVIYWPVALIEKARFSPAAEV